MEKLCDPAQEDDQMDMPPGFRFHPTDEELITHYLSNKVVDSTFFAKAIGEVDMNRIEPWELPSKISNLFSFYLSCYLFELYSIKVFGFGF